MTIQISEQGITITELVVPRKDIAEFLCAVNEADREAKLIDAMEVGVWCLQRASMGQDIEFFRRQTEALARDLEARVKGILGTENGQVLAPLRQAITEKAEQVRTLLEEEIDPRKTTTTLGKALDTFRNVIDPQRTDSIHGLIKSLTGKEGELAKHLSQVMTEKLQPVEEKMNELSKAFYGRSAVEEALQQTTRKGFQYEEQTAARLQAWASQYPGTEVNHVGADNQAGDIVIFIRGGDGHLIAQPMRIVIEVRSCTTPVGRQVINSEMTKRIALRGADAGIYLSQTQDGLSRPDIGYMGQGHCPNGPWIACTDDYLFPSIGFLLLEHAKKLRLIPEVDLNEIQKHKTAIDTALGRIGGINRHVAEIGKSSDGIRKDAEDLKNEIKRSVDTIWNLLLMASHGRPLASTPVNPVAPNGIAAVLGEGEMTGPTMKPQRAQAEK